VTVEPEPVPAEPPPVPAADLGGPMPGFADVVWVAGKPAEGMPQIVAFALVADGGDQPLAGILAQLAQRFPDLALVALLDGDDPAGPAVAARLATVAGVAPPALRDRWLGPDAALPACALVAGDGTLLWRGGPESLVTVVERAAATRFDPAPAQRLLPLRSELRERLAAIDDALALERALELTAGILAIDPLDEESLRLRLDLCRHLGRADAHRATLAGLPLAQCPPSLAAGLAWQMATDEDLAWRHLDLALAFAQHARRLAPDDVLAIETHARVLYLLGLFDEAIATQLAALAMLPEAPDVRAALDYYREAKALRDDLRGTK
jgi:hypothetical protein